MVRVFAAGNFSARFGRAEVSILTRPKTICGGGQIVFVLAGTASASTHVPAQMAICAGGRLKQPPPQMGFALAGR